MFTIISNKRIKDVNHIRYSNQKLFGEIRYKLIDGITEPVLFR